MGRTLSTLLALGLGFVILAGGYMYWQNQGKADLPAVVAYTGEGGKEAGQGGGLEGTTGGMRAAALDEGGNPILNAEGLPVDVNGVPLINAEGQAIDASGAPLINSEGQALGADGGPLLNAEGQPIYNVGDPGDIAMPDPIVVPEVPVDNTIIWDENQPAPDGNGTPIKPTKPSTNVPDTSVKPAPDPVNPAPPAPAPDRTGPISLVGNSGGTPGGASGGAVGPGSYANTMSPGVWRSSPGCEYNVNGSTSPLQPGGINLVEIRSGDTFQANCTWTPGYPGSSNKVSYGVNVVGKTMPAGSWKPSGEGCSVALLKDMRGSNFVNGSEELISPSDTLILKSGDIFYSTSTCGTWSKV